MASDVILVVDDEPVVLNIVAAILENAGYIVLRAASGDEVIDLVRGHHEPISLMIADVIMPGQSGPAVADAVAALRPEIAVLFMAGLPDTAEVCGAILERGRPFLPKPFTAGALLDKVHQALGRLASQ